MRVRPSGLTVELYVGRNEASCADKEANGRIMIARVWHGWTKSADADAYEALLTTTVLPGIAAKAIPGYRGADLLREAAADEADEVAFVTVLWFESLDDVRSFAGDDYAVAYVPAAARELLVRFDERSMHYSQIQKAEAHG